MRLARIVVSLAALAGAQLAVIGPLAEQASAAPALSVGPNINVSKTAGNQNEAGIGVDPTNPLHLFMAMNTDATAFPDGLLGAVSTDGGATWTTRHLADGVTDTLTKACCDPKVSWDAFGNLFLAYLNGSVNGVIVARSTDGGASFTQLTSIAGNDQPSITTGANSVWVTFEDGSGIEAAGASVTGLGLTGAFGAKQLATGSAGGNFGDIAIGPAGQVLVTYEKPSGGQGPATLFVNLDTDGLGSGGFGAQITATTTNVGGFDFITPQPDRSVDAEGNLAWDRTGGPHNGRVYLAYTEETTNESNNTDVMLRYSDDNGSTWSAPVKANDDVTTRAQFNPDISLDPTTGNVGLTWHDARNDSGSGAGDTDGVANTDAQRWGTASADGGATFLPNIQISAGTSHQNNLPGPGFADIDFGDYDTSTFYGNHLYSAWADNSNSTGDNPQGSLKQMDEYVANVTFSTNAPPPCTSTITTDQAGSFTVLSGATLCVKNARIAGGITVNPGGALTVTGSKVAGGIMATSPAFFDICGSMVVAPASSPSNGIIVSGSQVPIRIGDPDNGCAANQIAGGMSVTSNVAGETIGANTVSKDMHVDNNTVGNTIIKANKVFGTLECSGNNPPPTNSGQVNSAGSKTGQCSAL